MVQYRSNCSNCSKLVTNSQPCTPVVGLVIFVFIFVQEKLGKKCDEKTYGQKCLVKKDFWSKSILGQPTTC